MMQPMQSLPSSVLLLEFLPLESSLPPPYVLCPHTHTGLSFLLYLAFPAGHYVGCTLGSLQPFMSLLLTGQAALPPWPCNNSGIGFLFIYFFLRFYLLIHERHRTKEAETKAGEKQAPFRGARCGT